MYYVSVGDSLAAGVQPIGDPADLYRTDSGFAEQLLGIAREQDSRLRLMNFGCPGETTTTMINGGICGYPHGSQLDEAVAFLGATRSTVAFVTVAIGANDFPYPADESVPVGAASIGTNLPAILAALRSAAGPDVPIVGMTIYDPLLAAWLKGPAGRNYAVNVAAPQMGLVNGLLRGIYADAGVGVADVESSFSSNDFATLVDLPGPGQVPINVARIYQWTWVCAPAPLGPDNHANTIGYGVIARAFADVLGL